MENNKKEKIDCIKKSIELKKIKNYKDAIKMLEYALKLEDNLSDNIELYSQIGDLYLLLNDYETALNMFQKVLGFNKNHIHALQKCYEIYINLNQYQKALNTAIDMCEKYKNTQSYLNYLSALVRLGKYQDAITVFNTLDEEIKLDCDILYLISTINPEKKKLLLEKIIDIDQSHKAANIDLASIALEGEQYDKVVKYCLNLEEDTSLSLYFLAKVEAHRQNFTKAINFYLEAIKLDNDNHDFYLDLAKAYIDMADFQNALLALKRSINYSLIKNTIKNVDEKYFLIGWIFIKENEFQKAFLNLNTIDKTSIYFDEAQILIKLINSKNSKNINNNVSELEKYLKKHGDNPILLDAMAFNYKELKFYKKAIEIYKKALLLFPNSLYYRLEIVDLLIDDKNYDEAMELIKEVKNDYKNCANIYNSLARVYYRLDDKKNASEALDCYLKLDFNNAEVYYFKGLILNDLKEHEEAKKYLYDAIRLNPLCDKYYYQMARSYFSLNELESALLYSKEAIEINPDNITYKKQVYDISLAIGDEEKIKIYLSQLKRSEEVLKLRR